MPPKKEDKVVQLKGKEGKSSSWSLLHPGTNAGPRAAEDRVLQYMKEVRNAYFLSGTLPELKYYSATVPMVQVKQSSGPQVKVNTAASIAPADVSANIKNVVSKPAVQKILSALAERGAITQKAYGEHGIVGVSLPSLKLPNR